MDTVAILTFAAPLLVAIITALGTVYIARIRTKHDLNTSITSGFKDLTDQLQEERSQLTTMIGSLRIELAAAELRNAEMTQKIRDMRRQINKLEDLLFEAGGAVPKDGTSNVHQ